MPLSLPPHDGPERENAIRDQVSRGHFSVRWATITSSNGRHTAEFHVLADALKIDGVRVNVSAETQQIIADMTGCMLLTPKLADLIWVQREISLTPFPRAITGTTQGMIDHSAKIDAALARFSNPNGLIATVGKHWVIDDELLTHKGMAENYGWHFEGPAFQGMTGAPCASRATAPNGQVVRVIQGTGWAHNMFHSDYSQVCVLVSRSCKVDGVEHDLRTVLQDPELASLASHTGPMKVLRQPGVPEPTDTTIVIPEIIVTPGGDDPAV